MKYENGKKIGKKRRRGRQEGTPVSFVFKRSFHPICHLLLCNLTLVSRVKSCQSSNGKQTALFTELFLKNMYVFRKKKSFLFVFCKRIYGN